MENDTDKKDVTGQGMPGKIEHVYYIVDGGPTRIRQLVQILEHEAPPAAVIYAGSKDSVMAVTGHLQGLGHAVEPFLESMEEADRERVAQACASGEIRYLVTSEQDATGLDLTHFPFAIHYELPDSPEAYLVRLSPPGCRASFQKSVAMVSGQDLAAFRSAVLTYDIEAEERPLPSDRQMRVRREGRRFDYLQSLWVDQAPEEFRSLAMRIVSHHRGFDILGHVLASFFENVDDTDLATPENMRRKGMVVGLVSRDGREHSRDFLADPREKRHRRREDSREGGRREGRRDDRSRSRRREGRREERPQGDKLYIGAGKRHGFSHTELLALLEQVDMHPSIVVKSDVRENHSFVYVKKGAAQEVIDALKGREFKGRKLIVDRAKH